MPPTLSARTLKPLPLTQLHHVVLHLQHTNSNFKLTPDQSWFDPNQTNHIFNIKTNPGGSKNEYFAIDIAIEIAIKI